LCEVIRFKLSRAGVDVTGERDRSPVGGGTMASHRHRRILACALASAVALAPSTALAASWAQFHRSASRAGVTTAETVLTRSSTPQLAIRWSAATLPTPEGINSSPAIARGAVVVGSDDGFVYSFDERTGALRWSVFTGSAVRSSPAVANGRVVVGNAGGAIYALDADTGAGLWSYGIGGKVTAAPLVVGGTVYVGSRGGSFVALDLETGDVRWRAQPWATWAGPSYANGLVYVGSDRSAVFAFDAVTGQERWSTSLDGRVRSSPSVRNGLVYAGTDAGSVYAMDATTGEISWRAAAAPRETNAVVRSSPAIVGGRVIVTTGETTPMDGHAVALDATTGATLWSAKLADYSTSSPAIANGVVYLGSFDTRLYALDVRNGRQLWTSGWGTLPRGINSSPAIANGRVVIGVRDGSVYSFGLSA